MLKDYRYEEIEIGLCHQFSVVIEEKAMAQFLCMSGDTNPLHQDEAYAKEKGFLNKVVYGVLTSAYYSRLIGVYLPGKRCLLQEMEVKYKHPAYVGDTLTVVGTVAEKHDLFSQIVIKAEIRRASDQVKISQANIKVGVLS